MNQSRDLMDIDMRQDFEIPVFIGFQLTDFGGIKGIAPEDRHTGIITRKNGKTILNLSIQPEKSDDGRTGVIKDLSSVKSYHDKHPWYATTWDGKTQFIIREYYKVHEEKGSSYNSISYGPTSRWEIDDFSITKQFMLKEKVHQAKLNIDHAFYWFGLTSLNDEKIHELKYKKLYFEDNRFSIHVFSGYRESSNIKSTVKDATLNIFLKFEKLQEREYVYRLAVQLRNLLQILTNKEAGIRRIELNKDRSFKTNKKGYTVQLPRDERENWNIVQSFLPDNVKDDVGFSREFKDIKDDFQYILKSFFEDKKLQGLLENYLLISHYRVPVSTAIITLVSGIETYYRDATYSSNGKPVSSSIAKLERLMSVIDDPQKLISENFEDLEFDMNLFLARIRDERDYFIHGVKKESFVSEAVAGKDLVKFTLLVRQAIVLLICNPEEKTEFTTKD